MKKLLKIAAISLLFLFVGFVIFSLFLIYNSLPKLKGKVTLGGLSADVEIIRDMWGVPHIFAQNEEDLFFALGYVHAQERMWQMELTRRAGYGRLSEVFGERALERDKFLRTLCLREAAQKDFEKLSPELKQLLLDYCRGINSWLNSRKLKWPPEFLILRYRPQDWSVQDVLIIKEIMALLLCMDYQSEIFRAKLVKKFGPERALQILEEGVVLPSNDTQEGEIPEWFLSPNFQGSNNWVLAGWRTETGKPLLANDPHLEISLPSIWYEIHLKCPSLNVIGVSLPGTPGVIIGHNEFIAWGMTNSGADVQDLYIEKLNSSQDSYLDKEGWKPLRKKEEMIRIRGRKEFEKIEVLWTERGPIVSPAVVSTPVPLSLRWTIYDGGRTLEAFYLLNKARTWDEFINALALFDVPSQSFVYADKEGNIGYYLSGSIPLRPKETALFPFPGWKEEGDWRGYIKEEERSKIYNPERGFIITANNKVISDDYPYYVSSSWLAPFREERIRELVLQKEKHTVETQKEIQNDILSKEAELFYPYISNINETDEETRAVLEMFKGWDYRLSTGSKAALYKVFMNIFHEEVFKDDIGEDFKTFDNIFGLRVAGLLRILSNPLSPWFDNKDTPNVETRDEIIRISLKRSYDWLKEQYGPVEKWDWTKINSIRFKHPLGEVPVLKFFNRGPYPVDGDANTVRVFFITQLKKDWGASYRQIIDLFDFEKSVCVISSGQSGHFLSRCYDDQIPLWLEGKYHPMLFNRDNIEANAAEILMLKSLPRE
ncbi:MAG: penicillin acylase family protein [Candidatus Aminicenantaceae bacterium]